MTLHSGGEQDYVRNWRFSEVSPSEYFLCSMLETENLQYPQRWYVEGSDPAGSFGRLSREEP